MLGQPVDEVLAQLCPGKRPRVLDSLHTVGRASPVAGGWRAESEVFRSALAAAPSTARPTGVERFFEQGRLTVFPSRAADREAVLAHIAGRLIAPGRTAGEREATDDLTLLVDDPVTMRRRLVDAGLLVRSRDGRAYTRAT